MSPRGTPPPCVLSIAGSDSGGGAGMQADARVIRDQGCHALTAVTAITAQDGRRVLLCRAVPPDAIAAQIDAACAGFRVAAVKTGLFPGPAAIRAAARSLLRAFPGPGGRFPPLVIDPVFASSSGTRFLSAAGVRELRARLIPLAALVTPNWPEAGILLGRPVTAGTGPDGCADAAARLADQLGRPVLLKGGHAPGGACPDMLARPGGARTVRFHGIRILTVNTHGTGCALSAAVAARLALGDTLEEAVAAARGILRAALAGGRTADWGRGARGPAYP